MMRRPWVMIVAALAMAGCSSADDPDPGQSQASLHFLMPDSSAPGFIADTVQFYAVAGQDRRVTLYYQDSTPFATFDVGPRSLNLPVGDSVLITVAIADSSQLIVGFQPSGLVFASGHSAQLTLSFAHASQNLTPGNESKLSLWRQEHPGDPWHKVPSTMGKDQQTVTGRVDGFTVYATAY